MTNFVDALQEKIDELEEQKAVIDDKIELLRELMESETGKQASPAPKRKGRPKGSKNRRRKQSTSAHAPADELYDEAMKELSKRVEGGTTPELQEKLTKNFVPVPRPARELGVGITAGTKEQVKEHAGRRKSHATVSVDDSDLKDD